MNSVLVLFFASSAKAATPATSSTSSIRSSRVSPITPIAMSQAMNFTPGWINFFIGTDMLLSKHTPQWIPIKQSTMNLTFGLGIPLGPRGNRSDKGWL